MHLDGAGEEGCQVAIAPFALAHGFLGLLAAGEAGTLGATGRREMKVLPARIVSMAGSSTKSHLLRTKPSMRFLGTGKGRRLPLVWWAAALRVVSFPGVPRPLASAASPIISRPGVSPKVFMITWRVMRWSSIRRIRYGLIACLPRGKMPVSQCIVHISFY